MGMFDSITGPLTAAMIGADSGGAGDYSDVLVYQADQNKTVALAQIQTQSFGLQQAALDRELQLAVQTELSFETFDNKLQTASLEYRQFMTAEQNRHSEQMAEAGKGLANIESVYNISPDLPPPEES